MIWLYKLKQSSNHTHTHNVMYLPVDDTISDDNTASPVRFEGEGGVTGWGGACFNQNGAPNWSEWNWRANRSICLLGCACATTMQTGMPSLYGKRWQSKGIHLFLYTNYLCYYSLIKRFNDKISQRSITFWSEFPGCDWMVGKFLELVEFLLDISMNMWWYWSEIFSSS